MGNLRTAEEAKAEIKKGLTISKWSMQNGLPAGVVYSDLKGRLQGLYGDGHKAAVLLGLKEGEIDDDQNEKKLKRA